MPKLKTHRGAAKRLKRTGSGKIVRMRMNASHNLGNKNMKHKRRLRSGTIVSKADHPRIDKLIPR
jgi:large subunit ribosomal protein L35